MSNRLANEKSLYLRQHAENPVDWYPWGEEALKRAQQEDKPLLISIGYSACHWCHVMAHECFENEYIAGLMNRHFVCIKIDREERPDLDHIYMEAVQMIAHHGGWPLNVFCLPDGRPFFGGTYFPPEDRGSGMIPWPQLLMRVRDHYEKHRSDLEENAKGLVHNLLSSNYPQVEEKDPFHKPILLNAAAQLLETHDNEQGGWGEGPKFPHAPVWMFLARIRALGESLLPKYEKDDPRNDANQQSLQRLREALDPVMLKTLESLGRKGLYDHVGGGFFRYCVDREWTIPHFEKMLYDNGQLLEVLVAGYAHTRLPWCAEQVEQSVQWLCTDMLRDDGGFAAAVDADSEGGEGAYYVWTIDEIEQVLGERSEAFIAAWDIASSVNFEERYIHLHYPPSVGEERSSWQEELNLLKQARSQRSAPVCDRKIILSWNALVLKGITVAAYYFQRKDWFELAQQQARFLISAMRDKEGKWYSVYYDRATQGAFLDDLAMMTEFCLTLDQYAPLFGERSGEWKSLAIELGEYIVQHYRDGHSAGYYFTADSDGNPVVRKKEFWDNALPAGNSTLLGVFYRLWLLTGNSLWQDEWLNLIALYPTFAEKVPQGVAYGLYHWTEALIEPLILKKGENEKWNRVYDFCVTQPLVPVIFQDSSATSGFELCRGTACKYQGVSELDLIAAIQQEYRLKP
jgi:uncharacterized protein YyaL (SSP411 family)